MLIYTAAATVSNATGFREVVQKAGREAGKTRHRWKSVAGRGETVAVRRNSRDSVYAATSVCTRDKITTPRETRNALRRVQEQRLMTSGVRYGRAGIKTVDAATVIRCSGNGKLTFSGRRD